MKEVIHTWLWNLFERSYIETNIVIDFIERVIAILD